MVQWIKNNFNYYKKYKNLKGKNKRYKKRIRKLEQKLNEVLGDEK